MTLSIKNLWKKISFLGIDQEESFIQKKTYILANQINFLLFLSMTFMAGFMYVYRHVFNVPFNMGDVRINIIIAATFFNIVLSYFGKLDLLKISLLFVMPFLLIVFPTLTGFVETESYFYYPLIVVIYSSLTQLLLIREQERMVYIISLVYFGAMVLFIDDLLVRFSPPELNQIIYLYNKDVYIIKVVYVIVFFFLHFAIIYLKNLNRNYEQKLLKMNRNLMEKNNILDMQNEELTTINNDLKKTQQQLVHSEKMASLGVLTAGIAHEINNPLNFISGGAFIIKDFLNNIKDGRVPDEESLGHAVRGSETITKGIEQAVSVVRSLMTFSYSGKTKKKSEDLNKIIESTLLFLKQYIPTDLRFEKRLLLERPVYLYPEKVHQIVLNLVDNALFEIKNSDMPEEEKFLSIETGINEEEQAFVKVSNSGRNIGPGIASKLFDPFFTTKEQGQGTGLGLSIVHNLVKEHRGNIDFRNIENGVEFTVAFPFDDHEAPENKIRS